jgi:transaldolase
MSKLEELKKHTIIVADTGEVEQIKKFKPRDATTNPSLILAAAGLPEYKHLIDEALEFAKGKGSTTEARLESFVTKVCVNFGVEILKTVPGRVSTEVDARLSFDTEGSIKKAHEYIALYKEAGIDKERILIKLAATWEGIEAAKVLEKEGIHCNLTLMFSLAQAAACAEANATLISPFVGRIFDWYKKAEGKDSYPSHEDPGVLSVAEIFHYYKHHGYKTEIMGASFRNVGEILELAGCDLLTIAPKLLDELAQAEGPVPCKLDRAKVKPTSKISVEEKDFRFQLNENPMAVEKLSEGIRKFSAAIRDLESMAAKSLIQAA